MYQEEITEDGSVTLFNQKFQEAYHSRIGAYTEALHKHVLACKIPELASKQSSLAILDVCFGLGYNSLVAIQVAIENNPNIKLKITALENDAELLKVFPSLQVPINLDELFTDFRLLAEKRFIENKNYSLEILLGDARDTIKTLAANQFDAIFFDPFSPKVCPELWDYEFIHNVVDKAKPASLISTYSSARIAKDNFAKASCKIMEGPAIGRRNGGVLAEKLPC